ncbi:MAG: plasmid stabilization protein [Ignavibacteria bacterium CG22_combo_CG10-13_8_21_14_all_37_15]|nr:MAG: plasmid stabilization protein [Ignavibacteria bacterium CG22_combo_CG10-13_8_21_14_all_37_15]
MKVELRKSAIKDLEKIHPSIKQRIVLALFSLENFPNVPNLKRLVNFDHAFRMRVGDYRILFDNMDNTIFVARIVNRKDSYKKK